MEGELSKEEIVRLLIEKNPYNRVDEICIYANAYLEYMEAVENIEKNGSIVAHPRTGVPLENPYLKIKTNASRVLRSINLKNLDELWTE